MSETLETTTISDLWKNRLPARFNKKFAINVISKRIKVNTRNVYEHISGNKLLAVDLRFIYENTGIGFTMADGFFLDERKYDELMNVEKLKEEQQDMEAASMFGMSKMVS